MELKDIAGMAPGIYDDIEMSDYLAEPAVSRSDLTMLRKNPMKYKANVRKESDAFNIGTAAHAALLQGDKYWEQIAVAPASVLGKNGARNTKAYKEWAADSAQINKTIITQDQCGTIHAIRESVFFNPAHRTALGILSNESKTKYMEQTIIFEDATHGFRAKIRPDIRIPHVKLLVDVKTCRDASLSAFSRDCANYHYDIQAAFYLAGVSRATNDDYQDFLFVCIEKEPPYCVAVYRADYEMLDAGRRKIKPLIDLYNECLTADQWPGYPDQVVDLSLPGWAV